MRSKKALYNTFAAVLLQIITFLIGLILPRIIIDTYGSSINGLRASISQFMSYLYIIEMGLGGALIYSLYQPLVENNILKINQILSAAKISYKNIGYYFSLLVIVMMVIYPLFVYTKNDLSYIHVLFLVLAIGLGGIINYFTTAKYNVLLVASQSQYVVSIIRVIYLLVNTAIMILFIKYKWDIAVVYFISLISNILQVVLTSAYMKLKFKYISFNEEPDLSSYSKRYDVILHQISGMIVFGSPVLLLTVFGSLSSISIYSIYALIFTGINMIVGVFNSGFTAGFGQLIAENNHTKLKKSYADYEMMYYMVLSFVFTCVLILGLPFISIYTDGFTDANYVDKTVFILFVIMGFLNNWKIPQSTIIISAGHYKETRHRAIIEAILTLSVSTVFVINFGLIGVLMGSIVGLMYRSIDLFYAPKLTKLPLKITLYRLLRVVISGFLAYIPFYYIKINPENFLQWFINAILISIWIFVVVFFVNYLFERQTVTSIMLRVKKILSIKK